MGSEPAADSVVLEIFVKALCKGVVVVRIADEERCVERGSQDGGEILNSCVGKADTTQKVEAGMFIGRECNCIDINY